MPEVFMNRRRAYRLRRLYVRVVRAVWRFATAHQEFIMTLVLGLLVAALLALVVKLALAGAALALFETLSAKLRVFRAPEFLATAFLFAVLGLLVHLLLGA